MQALFLEQQKVNVRTLPKPTPGPGEVLIRVLLSGICGTDLEMINGYYPFTGVLGHEFVGVVEELGPKVEVKWLHQRVVAEINSPCGTCRLCVRLLPSHCLKRSVMGLITHNGCHAQWVVARSECLHLVPSDVPDHHAVFTEPLAAALSVLDLVHIRPSSKVLIIGAGRLGMFVSWLLAGVNCDVVVGLRRLVEAEEDSESKTAIPGGKSKQCELLESKGIPYILTQQLAAPEYESAFDVVVEATGNPEGLKLAVRCVVPQGTVVLKSTYSKSSLQRNPLEASPIVVKEVKIVGTRCGPFAPALRALASKRIDPSPLIDRVVSLPDALSALDRARARGVFKVLLKPTTHSKL